MEELSTIEDENIDLSSDDDSSDDENQLLQERAEEIERELSSNVYLYDLHVELVNIFEKLADLQSMQHAYERFAKHFPLTGAIWLKWINVEISLTTSDEEKKRVVELFERATKDYLNVKVWLEYVQFAMLNCSLSETHVILERALSVAGLHYYDSSLLWDMLRELELAHLSITSDKPDEYKAQLNKVVEAFRRQLSVPLVNINDTYKEWNQFISQLPDSIDSGVVEQGYNNALQKINNFKPFEEKLLEATNDEELYNVFKEYIKSIKDPSLIICLYERAIEKLCLIPQVWADYIMYSLKLGDVCLKITERALRNVTWNEDLWCLKLKVLEKFDASFEEVMHCFEQGLMSITGGLNLWLDYIGFTKRNKPDRLLKLLDQAEEQQIYDATYKLKRYHARICASSNDIEGARKLWDAILHEPHAKQASQFWLEYIRLERQFGSVTQARSIFKRAITCNTDWPQVIADEWMMFEQDEGTIDDVFKAYERISKLLPEKLKVLEHNAAEAAPHTAEEHSNGKRKNSHVEHKSESSTTKKQKKEHHQELPKNQGAPSDLDPQKSVFISNLRPTVTLQHLKSFFPNGKVTLATNNKAQSRCFGYVQFQTTEETEAALARDREDIEGRPMFISKCKADPQEREATFKFSQAPERNKLFVRGLPVKYTQDQVLNIFKPYNCTDVRLVCHKSGQSKGLAYIEFANEIDAENALQATNNMVLDHLTISVAISAPPPKSAKKERPRDQAFQRQGRTRLQMPFIPRSAMKTRTEASSSSVESTSIIDSTKPKNNNDFRNMLLN